MYVGMYLDYVINCFFKVIKYYGYMFIGDIFVYYFYVFSLFDCVNLRLEYISLNSCMYWNKIFN